MSYDVSRRGKTCLLRDRLSCNVEFPRIRTKILHRLSGSKRRIHGNALISAVMNFTRPWESSCGNVTTRSAFPNTGQSEPVRCSTSADKLTGGATLGSTASSASAAVLWTCLFLNDCFVTFRLPDRRLCTRSFRGEYLPPLSLPIFRTLAAPCQAVVLCTPPVVYFTTEPRILPRNVAIFQ